MMERREHTEESAMDMQEAPVNAQVAAEDFEEQYDKTAIEDEHIRYLNETKKLDKSKASKKAKKKKADAVEDEFANKANVKKAADRSADLIEARMNYDAGVGECDLAIELLKFSDHSKAQRREYKENRRRRAKIKKSIKKAKKLERKATKRYYNVLAKESASLTVLKKAKKQEELSIVLTRLESLIRERQCLDARLAAIYKSADSERGGKVRIRAERKKYKKARKVQRSLKSTDRRVQKMDVPQALKTKIRFLFNTKIVTEAALTYSKYLLNKLKPKGNTRKELKRNIKNANVSLCRVDDSIKRMVDKARRYEKSRKRKNTLLKVFVIIVLAAVVAGIIIIGLGA